MARNSREGHTERTYTGQNEIKARAQQGSCTALLKHWKHKAVGVRTREHRTVGQGTQTGSSTLECIMHSASGELVEVVELRSDRIHTQREREREF